MTENNPYQSPAAQLRPPGRVVFELADPRSVPAGRGWGWIADGFAMFKDSPLNWMVTIIMLVLLSVVLNLVPLVGPLILSLTYFVWTGGLMLGCRDQSLHGGYDIASLFAGFKKHAGPLVLMSIIVALASTMILLAIIGPGYMNMISAGDGGAEDVAELLRDPTGLLLRALLGMLVMVPVMMATWFAPALVVVNNVSVFEAMRLSFIGCTRNLMPFLVYGVIAIVLYVLALIPLFLGLLIFLPTMIASVFVGYRDIFIARRVVGSDPEAPAQT